MTLHAPDPEKSETVDSVFGVVSNTYRRHALYYLRDRPSATLDELTTVLAGWLGTRQDEGESTLVEPADRDPVRAELHHAHLPKLEEAGLVRYDHESGEVGVEPFPDLLEVTLDRSLEQSREASRRPNPSDRDRHAGQ